MVTIEDRMGQEGRGARQRCGDDGAWLLGELFKTHIHRAVDVEDFKQRPQVLDRRGFVEGNANGFRVDDAQIDAVPILSAISMTCWRSRGDSN